MDQVTKKDLQNLYKPPKDSHKGQNGRLLIIGGSHLFHAASMWALQVASRIVDLVHYASVPENNKLVHELKKEFRDGIVVPRKDIEEYIKEDDCILIGPGMVRSNAAQSMNYDLRTMNLSDIEDIADEGIQTHLLTNYLLKKYPEKQWVIDAGALQMLDIDQIPKGAILTPHQKEFTLLSSGQNFLDPQLVRDKTQLVHKGIVPPRVRSAKISSLQTRVSQFAKRYNCIVLVKGVEDVVCSAKECRVVKGGNEGMTKGGTGDVLAGLIAALACKNHPFLATLAGSFINKQAGDKLYKRVGSYFNASDLAAEIPGVMKRLVY